MITYIVFRTEYLRIQSTFDDHFTAVILVKQRNRGTIESRAGYVCTFAAVKVTTGCPYLVTPVDPA